jgi:hypothetical protein
VFVILMPSKTTTRKHVHLVFRPHFSGKHQFNQGKHAEADTIVVEHGAGEKTNHTFSPSIIQRVKHHTAGRSEYDVSVITWLEREVQKGKRAVIGERLHSTEEQTALRALNSQLSNARKKSAQNPSIQNLKHYYYLNAAQIVYRHALIRKTIAEHAKNGTVEGHYGELHTGLASELKNDGFAVSVEHESLFHDTPDSLLLEKINATIDLQVKHVSGGFATFPPITALKKIPDREFFRAWTALTLRGSHYFPALMGKPYPHQTMEDFNHKSHFITALISTASDAHIQQFLQTKDLEVLFQGTGIATPTPHNPLKTQQLIQYLHAHSSQWKHIFDSNPAYATKMRKYLNPK